MAAPIESHPDIVEIRRALDLVAAMAAGSALPAAVSARSPLLGLEFSYRGLRLHFADGSVDAYAAGVTGASLDRLRRPSRRRPWRLAGVVAHASGAVSITLRRGRRRVTIDADRVSPCGAAMPPRNAAVAPIRGVVSPLFRGLTSARRRG